MLVSLLPQPLFNALSLKTIYNSLESQSALPSNQSPNPPIAMLLSPAISEVDLFSMLVSYDATAPKGYYCFHITFVFPFERMLLGLLE